MRKMGTSATGRGGERREEVLRRIDQGSDGSMEGRGNPLTD